MYLDLSYLVSYIFCVVIIADIVYLDYYFVDVSRTFHLQYTFILKFVILKFHISRFLISSASSSHVPNVNTVPNIPKMTNNDASVPKSHLVYQPV